MTGELSSFTPSSQTRRTTTDVSAEGTWDDDKDLACLTWPQRVHRDFDDGRAGPRVIDGREQVQNETHEHAGSDHDEGDQDDPNAQPKRPFPVGKATDLGHDDDRCDAVPGCSEGQASQGRLPGVVGPRKPVPERPAR